MVIVMNKIFKKVIVLMCVLCMCMSSTGVAYAAENGIATAAYNNLEQQNGMYSDGAGVEYTTYISRECYEIRVSGNTYDSGTKYVEVVVYTTSGIVVASANHVPLNGTYTKMSLSVQFTKKIPAGTYVVKVDTSDTKDYDVSTYFYY